MEQKYILKEVDNSHEILRLWNQEMGFIYPIPQRAFQQNVINYQEKKIFGAYFDEKIVGFIILKFFNNPSINEYQNYAFVSLFYVSKKFRCQGIGSRLLAEVEKLSLNKTIWFGKDVDNFFPGIPTDFDNLTDVWLAKRGYIGSRYTHDLISDNPIIYPIVNNDVEFGICSKDDIQQLIIFLKENNWQRWAYEAEKYFENLRKENFLMESLSSEYIIAKNTDKKIIAFARINLSDSEVVPYNVMWQERFENLGGLGPLGVGQEFRKKHLGRDIISCALQRLKDLKRQKIVIDWTGILELYQKFNFEVWKSYKYMNKKIENTCNFFTNVV